MRDSGKRAPGSVGLSFAHIGAMRVSERDWLILRGRLRAFVSAAALPVVLGSMGLAAGTRQQEEEQGESTVPSLGDGNAAPRAEQRG